MISSKRFESVDGTTSRFLSDFIIQSEQHCRVYMYKYNASCALDSSCNTIVGGVYVRQTDTPQSADLVTLDKWDLVDNSIVFYITPSAGVTIVIEVATTPEEFGEVVAMPLIALAQSYATSAELSATSATASATSAGLSATSATASALSATNSANSATASALSATNSANTSSFQAGIATTKAAEATADVVLTHADALSTAADVVLTHADVVTSTTQAGIATTQATAASSSAALAQKWASELENVVVASGLYSAYHWAMKAAASAGSLLVDLIPTDGSTNAVSSNGVFDALAGKQATLTFDTVPTDASTNPVESNGIFEAIAAKADAANAALTGVPTAPTAANGTNTTQLATTAFVLANGGSGSVSGVRQTVQTGSVDTSGLANFLSTAVTLNLPIAATTTPLKIHASGGAVGNDRLGTVSADTTLLLTASVTSYIYGSVSTLGAVTFGSTTLAPIYQFGGTISVTNGQYTFDISRMTMFLGNGTTATQVYVTFIGEAVTSGSAVTSVVTYALNGLYDSGYTNTLPGSGGQIVKNHNIGTHPKYQRMVIKCLTAEFGYAIGDIVYGVFTYGTYASGMPFIITPKSLTFRATNVASPMGLLRADTGGLVNLTGAYWAYKFEAERGF